MFKHADSGAAAAEFADAVKTCRRRQQTLGGAEFSQCSDDVAVPSPRFNSRDSAPIEIGSSLYMARRTAEDGTTQ